MSPVLVAVFLVLLLLYLHTFIKARPPNFPPGPARLPVFGNYLQLLLKNYQYPYKALYDLAQKYNTKVLGMFYGSIPAIVVCDYEGIKEVLTRPELQGRFTSTVTKDRALGKDLGVFFVDGHFWEEQRRFSLRYMRDFGLGRRCEILEAVLQEEISDILDVLNGLRKDEDVFQDDLAVIPSLYQSSLPNVFLSVLLGERLTCAEIKKMKSAVKGSVQFVRSGDASGGFLVQQPWIRYLFPRMSGYLEAKEGNALLFNFIKELVNNHKAGFSEEYTRSFADIYTNQLEVQKASGNPTTFSEDQFLLVALDFLLAAATSQASALTFALVEMIHNPEIQRRVQQEIDTVVGRGRLPTLNDRPSLPYTEATLRESMRRHTLVPLSVIHRSMKDTTFRGYNVPKNTMIIPCLAVMHMDEDAWGDPLVFRPERFLDENGLINKKDNSLPFGAGKRLCPGETFSRQNIFLFFSALIQNFTVQMPEGKPLPSLDNVPGIIETSVEIKVKFVPRD